ncbi:glycosyltransferase [Anaerocolumna cellulosilytica]|uniref:Glycosyltransferase n=1 Tax=Anaerocolumna cellulosilytica TaxID=433286 RepID=A0A6S6QW66_9FIRM|nr:glycosyltransferase family 2 protein [Anaerocolumna cellulosilytica]MBB5197453.1 dolichol-phosphate mannosyltransferase [Anaerocolumna cellulosilytica]BCJ95473.1 glycosyltransferase [Anaerocolumna cellulosilytica]
MEQIENIQTVTSHLDKVQVKTGRLAIVIPVYQEGNHIRASIGEIRRILIEHCIDYEFILVDDGSTDNTWEQLAALACENKNITALRLTRNFGKEAAVCAGLEYADTEVLLVMDSDLQHPPELIPEMYRYWQEGYEVVEGIKSDRGKEGVFYKFCSEIFYRFLSKTSSIDLKNASDFKLLDKKVIEAWKRMPERTTFFRGMAAWVGFLRKQLAFEVRNRTTGQSKWSFLRLLKLAVGAMTSYTTVPLHFITIMGFIMFLLFLILGGQTLYMKLSGQALDGFTTVILLLLIIGSSVMISLGIIGIYLSKIYHEVKGRPRYLIADGIREGEKIC